MDIRDFSLDYFSLRGKSAIVTGGNTGLGQAFALALAKAGANVFIPSVTDDGGETRSLVEAEGQRAEVVFADVTAPGVPREMVEQCVSHFGAVDIVVNSAGICNIASVDQFDRAQWDPMIALNLTAPFELSFEAAKFMMAQRSGKIINRSGRNVREQAAYGTAPSESLAEAARVVLSSTFNSPILVPPARWKLPLGAFGKSGGPI